MRGGLIFVEAFDADEAVVLDDDAHVEALADVEVAGEFVGDEDAEVGLAVDGLDLEEFAEALVQRIWETTWASRL